MNDKTRILVIDDEVSVSRFIRHSLEANGYQVFEAGTAQEGLQKVVENRPELIILDYGLPDATGIDVLKRLREWSTTPVLFLTVRDGEADKVAALDGGADDYLTKPFGVPELLARLRVALRHARPYTEDPVFHSGPLEVDRSAHLVRLNGHELKLTATEYALLVVLVQHAGKVVPHRTILKEVWGPNSVEHNHYLRVYFGQIRKKMEAVLPGSSDILQNESGIGYRLRT
jgi:two-component system KDP operon response regulator KdpE